jgi:hypothetical protein
MGGWWTVDGQRGTSVPAFGIWARADLTREIQDVEPFKGPIRLSSAVLKDPVKLVLGWWRWRGGLLASVPEP